MNPSLVRLFLKVILILSTLNSSAQTHSLPLNELILTSSFGKRIHPVTGKNDFHKGIDLSAKSEPIYSILDGVVISVGANSILGNFIRIDHGELTSIYGHLSIQLCKKGDSVKAGDFIAVSGNTGRVTGEHLHFSILYGKSYLDPLKFLSRLKSNKISRN